MSKKYTMPDFIAHLHGQCDNCGDEDVDLFCVPGYMNLCQYCLENEADICDECGQIWLSDAVEFTETEDGRMVCEYCMEEADEDE